MNKIYYVLGLTALLAASCTKTLTADEIKAADDAKIKAYIAAKGWQMQVTPEGVYYKIDSAGSGGSPTLTNRVRVRYKGYLLDDKEFDKDMNYGIQVFLSQLIPGWQIGIPKYQKGGGGKLIIPSALGYGTTGSGSIPANAPLVFDINLVDFN
jgi:FKBP-type peptidyl-prolyl cis-trans isomerase FkpA